MRSRRWSSTFRQPMLRGPLCALVVLTAWSGAEASVRADVPPVSGAVVRGTATAPVPSLPPSILVNLRSSGPDLVTGFVGVRSPLVAGKPLGPAAKTIARNRGTGPAAGSRAGQKGYMIDVVLSADQLVPAGFATFSSTFREDVLLRGGRASNTVDLAAGASATFAAHNDIVPADTPAGSYYLCARIDPEDVVRESDEENNVSCLRVRVVRPGEESPPVDDYARTKLVVSPTAGLTVDARGRQLLFPMPAAPLRFRDLDEVAAFAGSRFGSVDARVSRLAGGSALSFTYRSRGLGTSYWRDSVRGLTYRVDDAVLARLGGKTGLLHVGTFPLCIDPDGVCEGPASYLVPLTKPTARSHLDQCAGSRCTQYHSFFNKVDFGFFKYARHGANTRLTSGSSGGEWRLTSCGTTATTDPDELVEAVRVTVRTGGDDLRGNSHVYLQLGLPAPFERSLNGGAGWGGGSVHTVTVPLPGNPRASQIASLGLRFHSGDCLFCTGDFWIVDELRVELITAGGARSFLRRGGSPFLHFGGATSLWSIDTAVTGDGLLCAERTPEVRLEVVSSNLVKYINDPGSFGPPGWRALGLPGVAASGVDIVETSYGGLSAAIEASSDGSISGGTAPPFVEAEADGICSLHRSTGGGEGRTGNGNHVGAEEDGLCP